MPRKVIGRSKQIQRGSKQESNETKKKEEKKDDNSKSRQTGMHKEKIDRNCSRKCLNSWTTMASKTV